jgi:addiction module HigA family antidote
MSRKLKPLHPGEVLREEFLEPLGLSAYKLAKACLIPRTRIERIIQEEVGISTDTALRLAAYFDMTPDFWLRLQDRYALETEAPSISRDLKSIKSNRQVAA